MKTKLSETASKFLGLIESDTWPILFSHAEPAGATVSITGDDLEGMSQDEVETFLREQGTSLEDQIDLWQSEHGLHTFPGTRFFSDGSELFVLVQNEQGVTGWINPRVWVVQP